ncbi:P-loop NTPase fold protein [Gordonia sp. NPDC003950]
MLATGGRGSAIGLWNAVTGTHREIQTGHINGVLWGEWGCVGGEMVLATGGGGGTTRLWNPRSCNDIQVLHGHTGGVLWGAWGVVGRDAILATGSTDGSVRLWSPCDGKAVHVLKGRGSTPLWGAWGRYGQAVVLAVGDDDGHIDIWDATTGGSVDSLTGHRGAVLWGAWGRRGGDTVLATGGDDATVRVWDLVSVGEVQALRGHTGGVLWGAWGRQGQEMVLATGGGGGTVRLWDPNDGTERHVLTGHTGGVLWGSWGRIGDETTLATGGRDGSIRLWDTRNGAVHQELRGHSGAVLWGGWADVGGGALTTGAADGSVEMWRVVRERSVPRLPGYRSDAVSSSDSLGRRTEATALAELITSRTARPPLAIGLFGEWGEGKSHFVQLLSDEVTCTARSGSPTVSHQNVRQVCFNAWHYAEADLWASLVSEVFTQLAKGGRDGSVGDDQRQRSRLAAEIVAERRLNERISAERARSAELRLALRNPAPTDHFDDRRSQLAGAIPDLGEGAVDDVYRSVACTRQWFRVRRLQGKQLIRALSPAWWACAALLLVAVAGAVVFRERLEAVILAAAGLVVLARPMVQNYRSVERQVRNARARVRDLVSSWNLQTQSALDVSEARVAALNRELQDLTAAGQLAGVVTDRLAEGGYRQSLGLMTRVREDFEHMATILMRDDGDDPRRRQELEAPDSGGDELPRIDRIVLYVDDLDRCPPRRVVDMLEAVHLLLAVPLFVVVVAVDPRWLLRSVAAHYRDILVFNDSHPTEAPSAATEDDHHRWSSTPEHYLEKIFQVAFTLPPLSEHGFTTMLDELVGVRADIGSQTTPAAALVRQQRSSPTEFIDFRDASTIDGNDLDTTTQLPDPVVVNRIDPLALEPDELQLLRYLGPPLIATPRSVKRLANSYGLLGAIRRLEAGDTSAARRLSALVLLAAVIGFPHLGPGLLTCLHRECNERSGSQDPDHGTWLQFVDSLRPIYDPERSRWSNQAEEWISSAEAHDWTVLVGALLRTVDRVRADGTLNLPDDLDVWASSVVSVGRLSFPAGNIVTRMHRDQATTGRGVMP